MEHGEESDRVECLASRIGNFLTEENAKSAKALEEEFTLPSNTLHYHLDVLVNVGLVENRKTKDPETDGLSSYY